MRTASSLRSRGLPYIAPVKRRPPKHHLMKIADHTIQNHPKYVILGVSA